MNKQEARGRYSEQKQVWAGDVRGILEDAPTKENGYRRLADWINIIIAKVREEAKEWQFVHDLALRREEALRSELATERAAREKAERLEHVAQQLIIQSDRAIQQLRSQLEAERENTDHKRKVIREQADKLQQLRSQLAAARAAIEKHNRNASDICHYHIQSK